MTIRDEQTKVQRAMNHSLSGLQEDPRLTQRVLANVKGERPVKKASTAFVLAMVLIFALSAAAVAAGSGLMDYLFPGRSQPTEQQKALVQSVSAVHAKNGVSTAITEALISGHKLSMTLSVSADRPVWVQLLGVTVNDEDAPGQDTDVLNQFIGDPVQNSGGSAAGGLTCNLECPVGSSARVKVRLALLVPDGDVVHKPQYDAGLHDKEVRELVGQNKVVVTGNRGAFSLEYDHIAAREDPEQNAVYEKLQPYYLLERPLTKEEARAVKELEAKMYTMADLYVHYGNMALLDDVSLTFSLNADAKNIIEMHQVEASEMPVHYEARLEQAQMDDMGFILRARLYPVEGGWTEEEIEAAAPTFTFHDENRKLIMFQDTWTEKDTGGWQTDEEGKRYTGIDYRMPALEKKPKAVYAVPNGVDGLPLWEDAIMMFLGNPEDLNG